MSVASLKRSSSLLHHFPQYILLKCKDEQIFLNEELRQQRRKEWEEQRATERGWGAGESIDQEDGDRPEDHKVPADILTHFMLFFSLLSYL